MALSTEQTLQQLLLQSTQLSASMVTLLLESAVQRTTFSVVIANGETDSAAFQPSIYQHGGVRIPAVLTGTSLSFKVSDDGTTYKPLYNLLGDLWEVPVLDDVISDLPDEIFNYPYVKLVSNAAEVGAHTLIVVARS